MTGVQTCALPIYARIIRQSTRLSLPNSVQIGDAHRAIEIVSQLPSRPSGKRALGRATRRLAEARKKVTVSQLIMPLAQVLGSQGGPVLFVRIRSGFPLHFGHAFLNLLRRLISPLRQCPRIRPVVFQQMSFGYL